MCVMTNTDMGVRDTAERRSVGLDTVGEGGIGDYLITPCLSLLLIYEMGTVRSPI